MNEGTEDKQMGRVSHGGKGATDSSWIGIREG